MELIFVLQIGRNYGLLADVLGEKPTSRHTVERLPKLFKGQQASTLCLVAIVVLSAEPGPEQDSLELSTVSYIQSQLLRETVLRLESVVTTCD